MTDRLEWFEQQFRAGVYTEADDDLRWLVDEVRRLRDNLAEERQEHQATLQMAADLRQRHAEAVEKALREGYLLGFEAHIDESIDGSGITIDAAWLASEARKVVER